MASLALALGPSRQFLRIEIHDWPYWIKRRQGSPSPFPVCRLCSALHSNPILRCFTSTLVFSRLCSQVTSCLYPFLISFGNFLLHVWHFEGVIREVLEFPCSALWCFVFSLRWALASRSNHTGSFREYATEGVFTWVKTRTGAIFIPGWLFDFVSRLHDEGFILYLGYLNVQFILIKYTCDSKSQTLRIHYPF